MYQLILQVARLGTDQCVAVLQLHGQLAVPRTHIRAYLAATDRFATEAVRDGARVVAFMGGRQLREERACDVRRSY